MTKVIICVVAFIMTACVTKDPRTIHGVNPEFIPYIQLYLHQKGKPMNYDIPMQFQKLSAPEIGICTRWSRGYRQVIIDPDYWYNPYISEIERISLIFHELGHCDLNRDHVDTIRPNGWPISLMYPHNFAYSKEDEAYYFNEMFNYTKTLKLNNLIKPTCVHDIDDE